jgi:hypothetical protein
MFLTMSWKLSALPALTGMETGNQVFGKTKHCYEEESSQPFSKSVL